MLLLSLTYFSLILFKPYLRIAKSFWAMGYTKFLFFLSHWMTTGPHLSFFWMTQIISAQSLLSFLLVLLVLILVLICVFLRRHNSTRKKQYVVYEVDHAMMQKSRWLVVQYDCVGQFFLVGEKFSPLKLAF